LDLRDIVVHDVGLELELPVSYASSIQPRISVVAEWVRAVLAFGLTAFRAQKQHLESSV
jgi:hypothetical protein